jgi:hypothetical protein
MTNRSAAGALIFRLVLAAAFLASQGCSAEHRAAADGQKDASADSKSSASSSGDRQSPQDSQSPEDRTLIAVSKAIRQAHLTERPDECLAYRFDANASGDAYLVEVRENHRRAGCGGDPQTQPRLFTVKVDKQTQAMSTDQGLPGRFHPLPK